MKTKRKVYIFDTTLRDGQQSPGAGMSFEDNLQYAEYAHELNIDVLEAGFPAASEHDFNIVHRIAKNLSLQKSHMTIAALCQLREPQVITTMTALQPSLADGKARLHTYVPVDPNLMQASLGSLAEDYAGIVARVYRLVNLAVTSGFEVEFSAEGYSRMQHNFDFTTEVIQAAVTGGARIINCPDTIGGASRWQAEDYFVVNMQRHAQIIAKEFPEANITWSAHCHNDLGLALDNSMTAVFSGPALQIEGCMNGVGERAGNVALEQCILIIDQFGKHVHTEYDFYTDINLQKLGQASDFIAQRMLARQPHWPITGENAARHSSGGHTNALLKNPMAYQPFDPKRVGKQISLVFGPLSGSNHAKQILEKHGFNCPHEEKAMMVQVIKNRYQDRRKGITDAELVAAFKEYCAPIKAEKIAYTKQDQHRASLHIIGNFFSETELLVHCDGENSPLAALDKAVKRHLPHLEIIDYRSNACGGSTVDAKCNSTVVVSLDGGENYIGKAVDADITIAAIKAYISAVNQAYVNSFYRINEEICA
jgi:2-isopropylmalate synthase